MAKEDFSFDVIDVFSKKMDKPMFENDFGSVEVRSTVHVKKLVKRK